MELCVTSALIGISLYMVIQGLRFIFADADFTLLWASMMGSKPETELKGLVVWITGASSGIGEELAYQLAGCGSSLILSARRTDELNRVKLGCLKCSDLQDEDILVLPLDLLERESHDAKTKAAFQHFGRIDILINNGGRSQRSLFVETSVDVYQALMDLNFLGTVSLTKQVLLHMTQRGSGSIVTISSVAGLIGVPLSTGYSASKHALQGFFNSLRTELSDHPKILISTVCPGPVQSQVVQNAFTHTLEKSIRSPYFVTPVSVHSSRGPATQDAHQSMCASYPSGHGQRHQGDVDSPAALSPVVLRVAVHAHPGLVPHKPPGQEEGG
ncbi:dehydrogenase/reductase SDR family member 7 isoform X2 [Osmerus mordax]|uniref:dehydrogenase/reductase SDR family member 7 isoform X2 n=1 Tax=Osmerus mordax TaxID=8014 RepID=UPI00350FB4D6